MFRLARILFYSVSLLTLDSVSASADSGVTYTISGAYSRTTSQLSGPSDTFSINFSLPGQPATTDFVPGDDFYLDTPVPFSYSASNGSTSNGLVYLSFYSLTSTSQTGGLFVDFCADGPSCTTGLDYQWIVPGPLLYSGPESSPLLFPTSFDFRDGQFLLYHCTFCNDLDATGTFAGHVNAVPTPEPRSLLLLLVGMVCVSLMYWLLSPTRTGGRMLSRQTRFLIAAALALCFSGPLMPQARPAGPSTSDIQSALAPLPQLLKQLRLSHDELTTLNLSHKITKYDDERLRPVIRITGSSFISFSYCSPLDPQLFEDATVEITSIRNQPASFKGVEGFELIQTMDAILENIDSTISLLSYDRELRENAKDASAVRQIEQVTGKLLKTERDFIFARAGVEMWFHVYLAAVNGIETQGSRNGEEWIRAFIKQFNKAPKDPEMDLH